MKEFLKNNTITYNLMSFTGFKSILIFSMLIESPKSYREIQEIFKNHEYLHENISVDAIRIYINSLKEIGCKFTKITDNKETKYFIESHPLMLKLTKKQSESIIKIYKTLSKFIELDDLILLQGLFNNISKYIDDEDLKIKLKNISPINNIDINLINELKSNISHNNEITILYNSPTSGKKNIIITPDKLRVENNKLYLFGYNSEYKNYSSFLVSKIIKIVSINIEKKILDVPNYTVRYLYYKDKGDIFDLQQNEKLIEDNPENCLVEITSKNKFEITQRLLFLTNRCKIVSPNEYKEEFITIIKKIREGYDE